MQFDLFAGIPVSDYTVSLQWYERFLGKPPAFIPNGTEAVWEVADHRYLYIDVRAADAGHAMHTVFVDDLDTLLVQIAARGLTPAEQETYSSGVRKALFCDPEGNEIGLGGGPT